MSLSDKEMFAAAAHLVLDLTEADRRGESLSAIMESCSSLIDDYEMSQVGGQTIQVMIKIFAKLRTVEGGSDFLDRFLNSLACDAPPRPDWMPDPHPLDLSQLEGA